MILRDMSDDELLKALEEDILMVANKFYLSKGNAYRRQVLKSKKFPIYFKPVEIRSRSKNIWIVYPFALSKKDADGKGVSARYFCRQAAWKTDFWYSLVWNQETNKPEDKVMVLTHHLIMRFKERMKLDKSGLDLFSEFIYNNPENYVVNETNNTFSMRIKGGVVMGEIVGKQWIHKTFISFENSSAYKQKLMYELLEDKMIYHIQEDREKLLNGELSMEEFCINMIHKYGNELIQYKDILDKKKEENKTSPYSSEQMMFVRQALHRDEKENDGYLFIGQNLMVKEEENIFLQNKYKK